ncbi:hypothetical protein D6D27_00107 [Aureobasidium pullulans]|nr:hypothetical protein D6D27_00107 [Aureobasidium pullulans]
MLSLRQLSRQLPRGLARLSSTAARQSIRTTQQTSPAFAAIRAAAHFSTSLSRRQDATTQELAAKLNSEIALEKEQQADDSYRYNCQEYIDNSEFKIEDKSGQEEVHLTRSYGDENIKVTFSIADFNTYDEEADAEDPALYGDEDGALDMDGQSGGANTKGAVNQGRTSGGNIRVAPEDEIAPADRPELQDEEDNSASFPVRVQVTVTREGKGALAIECLAQDGEISIENVYHFPTAELAEAKTAEKDWARRSLYTGPPFGQLDEDLQMLLERFLEERGINTQMALFIPEYIDLKEQKEYIGWLNNAERADRISRLAGLERVTTARNPTPTSNLTPGLAAHPSGATSGYFDSQGNPVLGRERSTVGSASATGSVGGRTTWASEGDVFDHDKMSESQDMDMDTSSVGAASDTNSLVGFGEGARTPARYSAVGSPSVSKSTPTASSLSHPFQRDTSLTPVSAQAQTDEQGVHMVDRRTLDSGAETAERIIRERLGPEGGQKGLESPDPSHSSGRDLGKFYFESGK